MRLFFGYGAYAALPVVLLLALLVGPETLRAETAYQAPLTQADIDGYVHLIPRLTGPNSGDTAAMGLALKESGLSRARAAYVSTKLALAQAMLEGYIGPARLMEEKVPAYLQPSAAELKLVGDNLETIRKARAAAGEKIQDPFE